MDAAPVGWGALLGEGAAASVGAGPFVAQRVWCRPRFGSIWSESNSSALLHLPFHGGLWTFYLILYAVQDYAECKPRERNANKRRKGKWPQFAASALCQACRPGLSIGVNGHSHVCVHTTGTAEAGGASAPVQAG